MREGVALVLLCHCAGDAHAEDDREVVDDEHQGLVDNGAHELERAGAEHGDHRADGLVGKDDAHDEQDAGNRQVHHRLNNRLREHLQGAFEVGLLLFCGHGVYSLPSFFPLVLSFG